MDRLTKFLSRILTENKRLKKWRIFSSTMAGIIVFVTTYSLILPAITIDQYMQEISLIICFKLVIRHTIINQAGISSINILDFSIHPDLKAFTLVIKKAETSVKIVQRIVCLFEEFFSVFKCSFFRTREHKSGIDQELHNNVGVKRFFGMTLMVFQESVYTKLMIDT